MATSLTTNGKKKISTFKKEFSLKFNYLTIQFLDKKRKEYDKSQIVPNLGLKVAKIAFGFAVPFVGLMMLTDKKKETPSYPYLPKTSDEISLENKLSTLFEKKKEILDLIEKEFQEIIRTTKNLNDLKNEILKIEEEIRTLNNKTMATLSVDHYTKLQYIECANLIDQSSLTKEKYPNLRKMWDETQDIRTNK